MHENPYKLCKSVKTSEEDQGVIKFRMTERMVDRDSEVIEPIGIKLAEYKKNPVFLWGHDIWGDHLPLGKTLTETFEQTDNYLDADVKFDLDDPFAALVYNKYVNGFLSSGSIRFSALAIDREPVLPDQKGITVTKSNLLEFSGVILPANIGSIVLEKDMAEFKDVMPKECANGLCNFIKSRNYKHDAMGWIDYLNKKQGDLDLSVPKTYFFNGNFKTSSDSEKILEVSDKDDNLLFSFSEDEIQAMIDGKYMHYDPSLKEVVLLEKLPDIGHIGLKSEEVWTDVAKRMNELIDNKEIDIPTKKIEYDSLVLLYKKFDKEPPEFAIIEGHKTQDVRPEDIKDEDILDEILKTLTQK